MKEREVHLKEHLENEAQRGTEIEEMVMTVTHFQDGGIGSILDLGGGLRLHLGILIGTRKEASYIS